MKLALAMIVRGADDEADLLKNCLTTAAPHVDGIFITATHKKGEKQNKRVADVAKMYGATVSDYEWDNNFTNARNFNYAQVPDEYDYILNLDADDTLEGGELIKPTIQNNQSVDAFSFWYLYAFDEYGNPIVVHHRIRVTRNDGSFTWKGELHENIFSNRKIDTKHVEGIVVRHNSNEKRVNEAKERNVTISKAALSNDPRSLWNYGNSLKANGKAKEAYDIFADFITKSGSEEEIYIARIRMAECQWNLGNKKDAVNELRMAIGLRPRYPDAYTLLGTVHYHMGNLTDAIEMLKTALALPPPYYSIVVFNPRDYDYTPLKWLAYSYLGISQPKLALTCLNSMLEITPKDKALKGVIGKIEKEVKRAEKAEKFYEKYAEETDLKKIEKALDKLEKELHSHPLVVRVRNVKFIKTESSGKDISIFCGFTSKEWTPDTAKNEGIGGSEEAVIHLSRRLVRDGYNVTVYNNCGHKEKSYDGVNYKPFWMWNPRDKQDVVILWRHPKMADYEINAPKVYIDLHDTIPEEEFTRTRLARITKILVKTKAHRVLYPNIPDDKFEIIPNGIDPAQFDVEVERDPYLLINTSSPERSLGALLDMFSEVKKKVPQAKLAWAYGWEVYDATHETNKERMAWKEAILKKMDELGVENLGKINHTEVAKLYKRGRILAYPTEFYEISCITAMKAQAGGAVPITTDFAALDETVQFGTKVHSPKTKETWIRDGQIDWGLEDELVRTRWVNATVKLLQSEYEEPTLMMEWAKSTYDWENVVTKWKELC